MPLHQCDCINDATPKSCAYHDASDDELEKSLIEKSHTESSKRNSCANGDNEVEILAERIGKNWTPLAILKNVNKRAKRIKKKPLKTKSRNKSKRNDSLQSSTEIDRKYEAAILHLCALGVDFNNDKGDEVKTLARSNGRNRTPLKPLTSASKQIKKQETKLLKEAQTKPLKTTVALADNNELKSSTNTGLSLWERIQEFKKTSEQFSAKKPCKLIDVGNDLELQKLIAQMEMMKLDHEFTKSLNATLHSKVFLPYETEDLISLAREVIMSRWRSMRSRGMHIIIFSEGFSNRIHPNYWGNELDEDLLENLHVQSEKINQTLFVSEKGICGRNVVNLDKLTEGEVRKEDIGSQCAVNFQHKKIFAKYHKCSKTMRLIQEGYGRRMTCYLDQKTRAHSHKKEVWCKKYNL